MQTKENVIAIDGPAGSGKSTVAKQVAQSLSALYIDTGAMFRAIAYHWQQNGLIDASLEAKQADIKKMQLDFIPHGQDNGVVMVNGQDVTLKIREHAISQIASTISQLSFVRDYLLQVQRKLVEKQLCVMEGRDIGTVVFPRAFCKIFLTASLKTRAERRYRDLQQSGSKISLDQLMQDLKLRDQQDTERANSPLKQDSDAILLDSTDMNIDQVVAKICSLANMAK
jgi:cytidylate kinase